MTFCVCIYISHYVCMSYYVYVCHIIFVLLFWLISYQYTKLLFELRKPLFILPSAVRVVTHLHVVCLIDLGALHCHGSKRKFCSSSTLISPHTPIKRSDLIIIPGDSSRLRHSSANDILCMQWRRQEFLEVVSKCVRKR